MPLVPGQPMMFEVRDFDRGGAHEEIGRTEPFFIESLPLDPQGQWNGAMDLRKGPDNEHRGQLLVRFDVQNVGGSVTPPALSRPQLELPSMPTLPPLQPPAPQPIPAAPGIPPAAPPVRSILPGASLTPPPPVMHGPPAPKSFAPSLISPQSSFGPFGVGPQNGAFPPPLMQSGSFSPPPAPMLSQTGSFAPPMVQASPCTPALVPTCSSAPPSPLGSFSQERGLTFPEAYPASHVMNPNLSLDGRLVPGAIVHARPPRLGSDAAQRQVAQPGRGPIWMSGEEPPR